MAVKNKKKKKEKKLPTKLELNAQVLSREMQYLHEVLGARMKLYFQQDCPYQDIYQVPIPVLSEDLSVYSGVLQHYGMNFEERIILLIALAPHICPQVLDEFFVKNSKYGRGFSEFGGVKGSNHSGFIPTGETVAFVLSANDLTRRFSLLRYFDANHFFNKFNILKLEEAPKGEPELSGILKISKEYLAYFTDGLQYEPKLSVHFPAEKITSELSWEELILEDYILDDLNEILAWIQHKDTLLKDWGLAKHLTPGYKSLFHGPPGTGKTLTACLLGKKAGLSVYRVDLSKVVSKYIGETEKNLANIFDQAESKNWILFFDEADALFGKRSSTKDAKDRYANQEIAYLLQRIETFNGVVILASNLKTNIDEAFSRRFHSIIYFPMPKPAQRLHLWQNAFSQCPLEESVDLEKVAHQFELAGGAINNILRYCSSAAVQRQGSILQEDILNGIRREYRKKGKTI